MDNKKTHRSLLPNVSSLLRLVAANHPMVVAVSRTREHGAGRRHHPSHD